MCEEAHDAEPIVDGDNDHALLREHLAVVKGACARVESAAVNPDHDGSLIIGSFGGGIDVEIEAILAELPPAARALNALRGEFVGGSNAGPGRRGLGSLPAQVADRRLRERDAFEYPDFRIRSRDACEIALSRVDRFGDGSSQR